MSNIDHEAFFIDGAWRPAQSDDRFDIISPRSEQVIGHVPGGVPRRHRRGRRAARKAFDEGEWPRLTPAERADYLTRMADAIAKRQERAGRAHHRGARAARCSSRRSTRSSPR